MAKIIANNIVNLINEKIKKENDPEAARAELIKKLESEIPRNRLTGLMRGTYGINRDEIWIVKDILGCETADEVVVVA